MTEMDVLAKMYKVQADMDRRIDHLEYVVVQLVRVLDHYPEIDLVTESAGFKALAVDLEKRVYGKAKG